MFVPILCVYLIKTRRPGDVHHGFFAGVGVYGKAVQWFVRLRCWWFRVTWRRAGHPLADGLAGRHRVVPADGFGRVRAPVPAAARLELRVDPPDGREVSGGDRAEAKTENIAITMGFVGQVAPNFGIDNMVLFMRGPDDGQLRVELAEKSGIKLAEFRERLRKVLPERVIPGWPAGSSREDCPRLRRPQAKKATFGFEPGDIVTQVMSFGSPTPIAVRLIGTDLDDVRQHAEKIAVKMKRISFLRDIQFEQTLDYPTVEVDIDREKAGLSNVTVEDVRKALVMATSSTRSPTSTIGSTWRPASTTWSKC